MKILIVLAALVVIFAFWLMYLWMLSRNEIDENMHSFARTFIVMSPVALLAVIIAGVVWTGAIFVFAWRGLKFIVRSK